MEPYGNGGSRDETDEELHASSRNWDETGELG